MNHYKYGKNNPKYIEDENTGHTYFIKDGEFYSAPTYSNHSIFLDESMLVSEWQNMEDFLECSSNFTSFIRILEKLMKQEVNS